MKTTYRLSLLQIALSFLCALVLALYRAGDGSSGKAFFFLMMLALILCIGFAAGTDRFRRKSRLHPAEPEPFSFAITACGGLLLIAAGFLFFLQRNGNALLRVVEALLCALAGIGAILRIREKDNTERAAVYATIPIFMLAFFLLMFYRSNGDNPHLEHFGYEIAVLVSSLTGVYFSVSGRFGRSVAGIRDGIASFGAMMILQEWIFFLLRGKALLAQVRGLSVAALVMLLGCAALLFQAIFCPPQKYSEPARDTAGEAHDHEEA